MQSDLVGIAAGGFAVTSAFGLLGLALLTDFRGLTTWHAGHTMSLRELRGDPARSRQYRLERYWLGGALALGGCGSAVVCLGLFIYALF